MWFVLWSMNYLKICVQFPNIWGLFKSFCCWLLFELHCSQKIYFVWFQSIYCYLFYAHGLPCDLMQLLIWMDLLPSFSFVSVCVCHMGWHFSLAAFKIFFDVKPFDYDMNGCGSLCLFYWEFVELLGCVFIKVIHQLLDFFKRGFIF